VPNTNPQILSSVQNALRLLKLFTIATPEKRLTELATELGLGKSTTSRLLSTLLSEGFVLQDPITHKYRLGQRIVSLYNVIITSYKDLAEVAKPLIARLAWETSEVIVVAVLEEDEIAYIFQEGNVIQEDLAVSVGVRNPAHCTSSGKLLLAYEETATLRRILERPLNRYTSNTITDPTELKEQISRIRDQDYCVSIGEYIENIVSISAPLRDSTGQVISAITLMGPTHRLNEERITSYTKRIVKTAKEISRQFGYLQ
jgi:IclR family transcriptional regulator, KDG regulon repressor